MIISDQDRDIRRLSIAIAAFQKCCSYSNRQIDNSTAIFPSGTCQIFQPVWHAQQFKRDISKWDVPNIYDMFGTLNTPTQYKTNFEHNAICNTSSRQMQCCRKYRPYRTTQPRYLEVGRVKYPRCAWHAQSPRQLLRDISKWDVPNIYDVFGMLNTPTQSTAISRSGTCQA